MFVEKLEVRVREGVVGRPEKSDLEFYFRGKPYKGPTISSSAYSKFYSCEHKWGLYAIAQVPQTEKRSTEVGKQAHAYLEDWLVFAKVPPATPLGMRMLDSGVLEHFPQPKAQGLRSEGVFAFGACLTDNIEDMVVFWGYKDVELDDLVQDLKSTSDLCWAKTPEELLEDPQATIYAMDNLLLTGRREARCRWVYFTTKGPVACKHVEVTFTFDKALDNVARIYEAALRMSRILRDGDTTVEDLPRNPLHCGEFGGCDYLPLCKNKMRAGAAFLAQRHQSKLEQERKKGEEQYMNALEKVKAKLAQSGVQVPANLPKQPVSPAPSPAPAASPTPAKPPLPALSSAKGRLAAAVAAAAGTAKPAEPARGVVPPDAPTPRATEEEEGEVLEQEAEEVVAPSPPPPPPAAPSRAKGSKKAPSVPSAPVAAQEKQSSFDYWPEALDGFTLLVDVKVLSGPYPEDASTLVHIARQKVEKEAGMPVGLIDYGRGPALVAAQLDEDLVANPPKGVFFVSRVAVDPRALEVLIRRASVVFAP
jgi:hypothetical protein